MLRVLFIFAFVAALASAGTFSGNSYCGSTTCTGTAIPGNRETEVCSQQCDPCGVSCNYVIFEQSGNGISQKIYGANDTTCTGPLSTTIAYVCNECKTYNNRDSVEFECNTATFVKLGIFLLGMLLYAMM